MTDGSAAVLHGYSDERQWLQSFHRLLKFFPNLGIEVDVSLTPEGEPYVARRDSSMMYSLEYFLSSLSFNVHGPIILDLLNRRAWPQVVAAMHAARIDREKLDVIIALDSLTLSYFGDPRSHNEAGRSAISRDDFGLTLCSDNIGMLKGYRSQFSTLFWMPEPRISKKLKSLIADFDRVFYMLPYSSPECRMHDGSTCWSPLDLVRHDLSIFEEKGVSPILVGDSDAILKVTS